MPGRLELLVTRLFGVLQARHEGGEELARVVGRAAVDIAVAHIWRTKYVAGPEPGRETPLDHQGASPLAGERAAMALGKRRMAEPSCP